MRIRWIVCIFILGMTVAVYTRDLMGGYIALFGCAIIYAVRRVEGAVRHQRSVSNQPALPPPLVTEAVIASRHESSPAGTRSSPIFLGDTAPMLVERGARKSIAKQ